MSIKWDARWFILLFLLSFVAAGQWFLGFFQRWDTVVVSVITAAAAELALGRLIRKQWYFPLSAIISGLGLSLLISSHLLWPYWLAALLAIGLKFALRYKGAHLFNPNNIALVFMLYVLPHAAVSTPKQWTNGTEVMVLILLLGAIAAYVARRLDTVIAFVAAYAVFAFMRHWLFGEPLFFSLGPMLGASFQLFAFFMITDPKTTPSTRSGRVTAALLIALLDAVFRVLMVTNSLFYSAFWVTLLFGIPYRVISARSLKKRTD